MTSRKCLSAMMIALATALVGPVAAQVQRVQTGSALDANYGIGSGGYNARQPLYTPNSSQLYVTGQVTGLGAFRGSVGYTAGNELGTVVPSASAIGDFRRQSVGLDQVITGRPYQASPWYNPSRTVLGPGQIAAGYNAPGSNIPQPMMVRPPLVVGEPSSTAQTPPTALGPIRAGIDQTIDYRQRIDPRAAAASAEATPMRIGTGGPLAMAQADRQEQLAREFRRLRRGQQPDLPRADEDQPDRADRPDQPDQQRRTELLVPPVGQPDPEDAAARDDQDAQDQTDVDQDVYLEMLYELQAQEQRRQAQADQPDQPDRDRGPRTSSELEVAVTQGDEQQLTQALARESQRVQADPDRGLVVHSLAGTGPDRFNAFMRSAQDKLTSGKYYAASRDYRSAVTLDPRNPLARTGLALALFSAGEAYSAAVHMRTAMTQLPALMTTTLDLERMSELESIRYWLGDIERRLAENDEDPDVMLRYIAAVMYQSLGRDEAAQTHARAILDAAPDDPVITAYAQSVLAGSTGPVK